MININRLKNKKIAILGMGVNNEKLVDFLLKNNLSITICDRDENRDIKSPHYYSNQLVNWKLGERYLDDLENFDIVFRSPGIQFLNPKIQTLKKQEVEISSQTKLFFELCPAMIIGVTGTKGKGTTSTLIYEILKKSGKQVFLAGNIGEDPFNYLERLRPTDTVVLELSSFQLQDLDRSPHIAVVLNITVDHLDHHKDREEYLSAKKSITKFQNKNDYIIANDDYIDSKNFLKLSQSRNLYFSIKKKVRIGCYYKDGWIWLVGVKAPLIRGGGGLELKGARHARTSLKICSRKEIKLLGEHNLENVCAAVSAAIVAGASVNGIKKAIKFFSGLEHRLEYVEKCNGVKYYNDSFSTTPQTTIAAIHSFDAPVILIAGGSDKGADFTLLANEIIDSKVKAVILIGDMANKILNGLLRLQTEQFKIKIIKNFELRNVIARSEVNIVNETTKQSRRFCNNHGIASSLPLVAPRNDRSFQLRRSSLTGDSDGTGKKPAKYSLLVITGCKAMRQIVKAADKISEKGDIVLLSPACASFDMFKNYKERGLLFKEEVKRLQCAT